MDNNTNDISIGDLVQTHIEFLNGGLPMNVIEVAIDLAHVSYFDEEGTGSTKWFSKKDLVIIHKADN
jgi:hypothetical protein